jgi:hypothetical protein
MKTITQLLKKNTRRENFYMATIVLPLFCIVVYGVSAALIYSFLTILETF